MHLKYRILLHLHVCPAKPKIIELDEYSNSIDIQRGCECLGVNKKI